MNSLILMAGLPGCDCGTPTPLETIVNLICYDDIGQIQRAFLVKKGQVIWDITTPANNIPASITLDLITEEAGWLTLLALATDEKVVVTPLVLASGGGIAPGAAVTEGGGDNSTPNGQIIHNGFSPADFNLIFRSLSKDQVKVIREWGCSEVEIYFINQEGKIIAKLDDSGAQDLVTGFPLSNFRLGTKGNTGFGTSDTNEVTAQMNASYDEFLAFFIPTDFSALTIE